MKPKVTHEELDDLYNKQRLSTYEVARRLKVSQSTVCYWMDQLNLPRRSLPEANQGVHLQLDDDEIVLLYTVRRLDLREIARRLNTSRGTVRNRLKARNVVLRTSPEAKRLQLDSDEIVRLYTTLQFSLRKIAQQFNVDEETIRSRLKARGIVLRDKSAANVIYPRCDFSSDPLEKAYLQGFRLGDLNVRMNSDGPGCATIVISTSTTRAEQINLFCELFSHYGHVNISPPNQRDCRSVECRLNPSFDFLLPKQDGIPEWILRFLQNGDTQPFIAFLAGYIDAEGCFSVKTSGCAEFRLRSYNEITLRQAHATLNDWLGISCPPVYLEKPKGAPTSYGGVYHDDCWHLGIHRKVSLYRLCELLDPYLRHAKRRADMYAVWTNVTARGV